MDEEEKEEGTENKGSGWGGGGGEGAATKTCHNRKKSRVCELIFIEEARRSLRIAPMSGLAGSVGPGWPGWGRGQLARVGEGPAGWLIQMLRKLTPAKYCPITCSTTSSSRITPVAPLHPAESHL